MSFLPNNYKPATNILDRLAERERLASVDCDRCDYYDGTCHACVVAKFSFGSMRAWCIKKGLIEKPETKCDLPF